MSQTRRKVDGGALDLAPSQLLLAQLDDVDAAAQRRPQQRFRVLAVAGGRRRRSRGARCAAARGAAGRRPRGREAHAPIMTVPNAAARRRQMRMPAATPAHRLRGWGGGSHRECNGSPRGLRGWHRGHRPSGPDPGNAGGGNGLTEQTRFRRDIRWRWGDRPLLRLARRPARRARGGARPRRAARRRHPGRRRDAGPGRRAHLRRAGAAGDDPGRGPALPAVRRRAGGGERGERPATRARAPSTSPSTATRRRELRRVHDLQRSLGLEAEWLSPRRCRELEPGLTPSFNGGVHAPGEAAVDPRALTRALLAALPRPRSRCGPEPR